MSYLGQSHHPHVVGTPPNAHLIGTVDGSAQAYIPAGLQLVQAHWYIRHGERAPVRERMTGLAAIPSTFRLCSVGRQFHTAVLTALAPALAPLEGEDHSVEGGAVGAMGAREFVNPSSDRKDVESDTGAGLVKGRMEVRRLSESQGSLNSPVLGGLSDCYWGELTDLGRQSTLTLGKRLRSLYVDQLGFLPAILPATMRPDALATFRSTGMNRTIESLHQVVEGLFPVREGAIEYVVRAPEQESLYPNSLCAPMKQLDRISAAKAAQLYNPTLEPLDAIIGKYVNGTVRIDGHPRANGILDTIMVCKAHGIQAPKEFDDLNVLEKLESAVVHEWFDSYQNIDFKRLAMGRLLGDLKSSIAKKLADPSTDPVKLAIYSCHDTSLAGILNALDAFDNRWPPFTSHISFEVFQSTAPSPTSEAYVRMRYNAKNIVLPACAPEGAHLKGSQGEVCTWTAFQAAVRGVEMTSGEWTRISESGR